MPIFARRSKPCPSLLRANDDDDGGDDDGDGEDNDNDSDTGDDDGDDDAYDRTRPMGYRTELGIGACRFPPMSAAHVRRVGWRGFRSPLPPPPRQRDCAPPRAQTRTKRCGQFGTLIFAGGRGGENTREY